MKSKHEELLAQHLTLLGLEFKREFRFHPHRRWRLDFAIIKAKIGIEVQGAMWNIQGRHQRPDYLSKEYEKNNTAAVLGWHIIKFTGRDISNGSALNFIKDNLEFFKQKKE